MSMGGGANALSGAERIAHTQAVLEKVRSERARRSSSRAAPSPARSVAQTAPPETPQRANGGESAASSYANQSPAAQPTTSTGGPFSSWYVTQGYANDPRAGESEWNRRQAAPLVAGPGAVAGGPALHDAAWAAVQEQQVAAQRAQPETQYLAQPAPPTPSIPRFNTAQPETRATRLQAQPTTSMNMYPAPQVPGAPPAASPSVADERAHLQQLLRQLGSSTDDAVPDFPPELTPQPQRQPQPQPQPPQLQLQPQPQPQQQQFEPHVAEEGVPSTSHIAKQFGEAVAAAARPAAEAIHSTQPLTRDDLKRLYDAEVQRQLHAIGGDEEPRMRKAHELLTRTGSSFGTQKPVGVWGAVAASSDLSKNDVVAIVMLLEEQLAEREKRERALETALQKAKEQPAPAPVPEPAPAPTPPSPVEPEEEYDTPIHPAASSETLGRHIRSFCEGGTHMVSRHGLAQALRSLPDTDRAKRMENKVLRMFDGLQDEGGFGDSPDRKLVAADAESQLTKLIVLIAHGERKEQMHFALSAMSKKGLPPAVTSALAEQTLAFAAQVFGDNPDSPAGQTDIAAAVKRCYSGVGQISLTEFRKFCYEDDFVRTHCFGDTAVVDATAHLRNAAFATGDNKWGGIAMAAAHRN